MFGNYCFSNDESSNIVCERCGKPAPTGIFACGWYPNCTCGAQNWVSVAQFRQKPFSNYRLDVSCPQCGYKIHSETISGSIPWIGCRS